MQHVAAVGPGEAIFLIPVGHTMPLSLHSGLFRNVRLTKRGVSLGTFAGAQPCVATLCFFSWFQWLSPSGFDDACICFFESCFGFARS